MSDDHPEEAPADPVAPSDMPEPVGGQTGVVTTETGPHRTFVDFSPIRASPAFGRLWIGTSISGIGAWLTTTAVGLEIFHIAIATMSEAQATFMVSLVGGIALVPMVVVGLWGGMLVDAADRRTVAIVSAIVSWVATLSLLGLSIWDTVASQGGGHAEVWPFYVVTTIQAIAANISGTARSAITPRIVAPDMLSRASALNSLTWGLQLALGPAIAGILIAVAGYPITYAVDAVMFAAAFIGIFGLPKLPPLHEHVTRPGLRSLVEGFAFLRTASNIRMSFIVDIIAMGLGRPQVLFPALSVAVIGGGSVTVGILGAAMAVGTFLTGLFSGPVARIHRHGVAISRAILVFGGFTVLLGLVIGAGQLGWFGAVGEDFSDVSWPLLILVFVMLVGTGMSDEVSAIFRGTMMAAAAPDEMRGRMQGIFMVVVQAGPRIGDLIAGTIAALLGLWSPPVLGGVLVIALVWMLTRTSPRWRAYDGRTPTP